MDPILTPAPQGKRRIGLAARLLIGALVLFAFVGAGFWLSRSHESPTGPAAKAGAETYYCPMHPHYKSDKPGTCPICSMKLVPLDAAGAGASPPDAEGSAPSGLAIPSSPPAGTPGAPARIRR